MFILIGEVMQVLPSSRNTGKRCFYIDDQHSFDSIMSKLLQKAVTEKFAIGFDIETSVDRRPIKLALLQITTSKANLVIDPVGKDLKLFRLVMASENIVKVIHYAQYEKSVLKNYGCEINNVFDTCIWSRNTYGREKSHKLQDVVYRELGMHMSKEEQTSDWFRRPLTDSQIYYAVFDSESIFMIYERINNSDDIGWG